MLDQIVQDKRAEVAKLSEQLLRNVRPSTRDVTYAIGTGRSEITVFAELKRRDPYTGAIRPDLDPAAMADALQAAGVSALVVDTESRHWGGSRDDLIALERHGVQIPIIRNDFVVEELQLYESRRAGADSMFLSPALLEGPRLASALRVAASMHMVGIVLVGAESELELALETTAPIIAISNRDLETGRIDLGTTLALAPRVPASRAVLACFGIRTAEDVRRLRGVVDGVCIGTALLQAEDPVARLEELMHS
jgi:indole-3-glycerol phosphate synthase